LESAKGLAMQRVVFSSSGAIYGRLRKADGTPIREDDPVQIFPTFLYRSAKMLGEWLGDFYETQHGVNFVALRFSAVYGQGQWFGIGDQLKKAVLGNPSRPTLTRGPTDDPIHVTDIARAVFLACFAEKIKSRSYNVASDVPYNNEQLFAAIRKALPGVAFDATANSEADNYHRQRDPLDMTLAKNELGFAPEYDLERGIAITAAWLSENKSRLSR
jgi:UDP-glucose 4-epimerase